MAKKHYSFTDLEELIILKQQDILIGKSVLVFDLYYKMSHGKYVSYLSGDKPFEGLLTEFGFNDKKEFVVHLLTENGDKKEVIINNYKSNTNKAYITREVCINDQTH